MTTPSHPNSPQEDPVRPHTFDGIQEYDKCMPNWWLLTFYASIVFAAVYWFYFHHSGVPISDGARVEAEMAQIEAARLSSNAVALTDDSLWQMSRNALFVEAGKATFNANCAACHLTSLKGKDENPMAIGPNLVDRQWLYSGKPTDVVSLVTNGTPKGMPSWGSVLGAKKISEAVAYVLSHHDPSELAANAQAAQTAANK